MNTQRNLRLAGMIGCVTALAMTAADILLLYSPNGGYQGNAYEWMVNVPYGRLLAGHYLGVLALPFYLIGFWHLVEGLEPAGKWLSRPVGALMGDLTVVGAYFSRQHRAPGADGPGYR